MNKLVALCISWILSTSLLAQSNFYTYPDFDFQGHKIEQNEQGYLIHTQNENDALVLIQTDAEGQFLFSKTFFDGSMNFYYSNNFFYETAGVGDTLNQDLMIRKLNENGNIIFEKVVNLPLDNYGTKVITTQDGGIAVAGGTQVAGDSLHRILITKFDANGNLLWQNITSKEATFHDAALDYIAIPNGTGKTYTYRSPPIKLFEELRDGGFIINNSNGYHGGGVLSYNDNIIRFDHQGKTLWNKNYITASKNIGAPVPSVNFGPYYTVDVDGYDDGSVVVTYNTKLGTQSFSTAHVRKFDKDGAVIWATNRYGYTGTSTQGLGVAAVEDGSAWWVLDDRNDWAGAGPAPFSTKGIGVYHIAAEPAEAINFDGSANVQYTDIKTYSNANYFQSTNFYENSVSYGIRPAAIISNSADEFVLTGLWGDYTYYSYVYGTLQAKISPFLVLENLENSCTTYLDGLFYYGTFDGHNYFISDEAVTREEAQSIAEENGGYLLTINSEAEDEYISGKIVGGEVWLGLSDRQNEGTEAWDNGEAVSYTNWGTCPANFQSCVDNTDEYDDVMYVFYQDFWTYTNDSVNHFIVELDCDAPFTPKSDLRIDSMSTELPEYVERNVPFLIDVKYYNEGAIAAQNVALTAYLSTDRAIDAQDIEVGNLTLSEIAVGADSETSLSINVPNEAADGDYYLMLQIDASKTIDELNETNNILSSNPYRLIKVISPAPDLRFTNINNIYEVNQGEIVNFTFGIENRGTAVAAGDYIIEFYMTTKTDQYVVESAAELEEKILLGTVPTGNTPVGTIEDITAALAIPADIPFGAYRFYAFIDVNDEIEEIDETNNHGYWETQTNGIFLVGDYGVDLSLSNLSSVPSIVEQGDEIPISFLMKNIGLVDTNMEEENYYDYFNIRISLNDEPNLGGYVSQFFRWGEIAAGETQAVDTLFKIPNDLNEGIYYIAVSIDHNDYVDEIVEGNNVLYTTAIEVLAKPRPDLTISNITNLQTEAQQGEVVYYNFDLNNEGDAFAAGNYVVGMYLSANNYFYNGIPDNAIEVGIVPTGNTPIGTISDVGGAITVPDDIAPGEYYLVIYADRDNVQDEFRETNNYEASDFKLLITSPFEQQVDCPDDMMIHLPLNQTSIPVNWEENSISVSHNCNNTLENVMISQTGGLLNGSHFETGNCVIEYTAQSSCNNAEVITNCTFVVNVATIVQEENLQVQICEGETYNGEIYTQNTSFVDTISSAQFDLIRTTDIQVLPSYFETINASICTGESYSFEGEEYTETGVYEKKLFTQEGCDSTLQLNLIVSESIETYFFESTCDENETGTFQTTYTSQNGCDSIVTIEVSLLSSDETNLIQTTCDETETGTVVNTYLNQFGCDSIVTIEVVLTPSDETFINATTCNPDEVNFTETTYTNQFGCDSIVTIEVSLLPTDETYLYETTCDEDEVSLTEMIYTNQYGCDSLVIVEVELVPSNETFIDATTCDPNEVGTFITTYANQFGCDSIVTLAVDLLPSNETFIDATTCNENEAGTFEEVYTNQFGCDSVVTTQVELLDSYITMSQDTLPVGTYFQDVLITMDTVIGVNLVAQNGCDSTHFYQISVLTTGIKEIPTLAFEYTIFPNPASTYCTIQFDAIQKEDIQIRIFNTLGQTIQTDQIIINEGQTDYALNLQSMDKGIYLIHLQTKNGQITEKLIVQ